MGAKLKFRKAAVLPAAIPANDGVWYIKGAGDSKFKKYIISGGVITPEDSISAAELSGALALKQDKLTGSASNVVLGDGTTTPLASLPISTPVQNALDLKANDNAVVKLSGNQTVGGVKTFSVSPIVPAPSGATAAVNKTYVDNADAGLQTQINNINTVVSSAMKPPTGLDCSGNPNYPASSAGDQYRVTANGRIGGASGPLVKVGDIIACQTTSAAGTHAAVGGNFYILETNQDEATETVIGLSRKATNAEGLAGSSDVGFMTSLKTANAINAKSVRFDASQSLTSPQAVQARANIGAAADSEVVKLTGNQTVAGVKTFSAAPKSSVAAVASDDLMRKGEVDALVLASELEWAEEVW